MSGNVTNVAQINIRSICHLLTAQLWGQCFALQYLLSHAQGRPLNPHWRTISDCPPVGASCLSVGAANQNKREQPYNSDLQHYYPPSARSPKHFLDSAYRFRLFPRKRNSRPFIRDAPSTHRQASVIGIPLSHEATSTESGRIRGSGHRQIRPLRILKPANRGQTPPVPRQLRHRTRQRIKSGPQCG